MASIDRDNHTEPGGQLEVESEHQEEIEMGSTNQQVELQRNICYRLCLKYRKLTIIVIVIVVIIIICTIAVVIGVSVFQAVDQTKN